MKHVHEGKQFQCKQCKKMLASKFSLARHNLEVHENESSQEDGEIAYKEVIVGTMMTEKQQDEIINKQNLTIEAMKKEFKRAKDELKSLRAKILALQVAK